MKGTEVRTDVVEVMFREERISGACSCALSTSIVLKENCCSSLPKFTASITAFCPVRLSADRGRQSPSENPFPAATWISFSLALSASSTGSSDVSNDPVPSSPQ